MINESSAVLRDYQSRVESALDARLPESDLEPSKLHEAMRYICLNGGKRIRAMLVYATGQATGSELSVLDAPACAVELIHAYSLVHDDLPAMDNDTLRRGKPTCHIAYDEATAILAGDGLHSLAFELLAKDPAMNLSPSTKLAMIRHLAHAAGPSGMVGGQAKDITAEGCKLDIESLKSIHLGKTGALIRAAVALGALTNETVRASTLEIFDDYAARIGLAFQIVDDVLDEESDAQTLGKNIGGDRTLSKATFPSIIGLEASKTMAQTLYKEALQALDNLGSGSHILRELAKMVVERRH